MVKKLYAIVINSHKRQGHSSFSSRMIAFLLYRQKRQLQHQQVLLLLRAIPSHPEIRRPRNFSKMLQQHSKPFLIRIRAIGSTNSRAIKIPRTLNSNSIPCKTNQSKITETISSSSSNLLLLRIKIYSSRNNNTNNLRI